MFSSRCDAISEHMQGYDAAQQVPGFAGTTWVSSRTFRFPDLFKQRAVGARRRSAGTTCRQTNMISVSQKDNSENSTTDDLAFDSPRRAPVPCQSHEARLLLITQANLA
jgi:hypothetical protein